MKSLLHFPNNLFLYICTFLLLFGHFANGQPLPDVKLQTPDGRMIEARSIAPAGKVLLVVFWRMDDKQSCMNLKSVMESVQDSIQSADLHMIAICNNSRMNADVARSWYQGQDLQAKLYFDPNGEFQRQMGITPPYTVIFDKELKIKCQHKGYCAGNESVVCKKIRSCLSEAGEAVD